MRHGLLHGLFILGLLESGTLEKSNYNWFAAFFTEQPFMFKYLKPINSPTFLSEAQRQTLRVMILHFSFCLPTLLPLDSQRCNFSYDSTCQGSSQLLNLENASAIQVLFLFLWSAALPITSTGFRLLGHGQSLQKAIARGALVASPILIMTAKRVLENRNVFMVVVKRSFLHDNGSVKIISWSCRMWRLQVWRKREAPIFILIECGIERKRPHLLLGDDRTEKYM